MARHVERPKVSAVTVERTPAGIRARAWTASAVARFWKPLEEDLLADEGLMDAIKRGMK